jgi:serine/threonine-protein kinase HipA
LLVVKRFDREDDGRYLGVEDFCVLTGRRAHGRYEGSYEELAKRITDYVSPIHLAQAREEFALMIAYACAIENGDAHLKNFSVIYRDADAPVRLAPAYDIVSTTPYSPRDTMALRINNSKQFPDRAGLIGFIRTITGKNERAAARTLAQALAGAEHAVATAENLASRHTEATRFAEKLRQCITRGIARLR